MSNNGPDLKGLDPDNAMRVYCAWLNEGNPPSEQEPPKLDLTMIHNKKDHRLITEKDLEPGSLPTASDVYGGNRPLTLTFI